MPFSIVEDFLDMGVSDLRVGDPELSLAFTFVHWQQQQQPGLTISSIPNELLAIIFEIAHESGASSSTISHVSSHWRDVALNLPSLWVKIVISPIPSLDALRAYLSRSRTLPLDVRFELPASELPLNSPFHSASELVMMNVTRWRRLVVECQFSNTLEFQLFNMPVRALLFQLKDCTVPLLEEFSINGSQSHVPDLEVFRGGAPKLTSIRLKDISFMTWHLPTTGLRTLHLHEFRHRYNRFRRLLEEAPLLTKLSLQGSVMEPFLPRNVSLPALKSLRYRFAAPTVNGGVAIHYIHCLPAISAPMLETLWLVDPADAEIDYLLANVDASVRFTKLRSLIVQNAKFSQATYDKIFEAIPGITHFTIIQERSLEIWELLCQSSVRIPWPDLHTVTLAIPWLDLITAGPESDEALLCDMLSSRISAGYSIAKLRIDRRLLQNSNLERLPTLVTLESVDTPEPWPAWSDWVTTIE